jgi:hypothetical protein
MIKKVHLIFKTHLDIGFTDFAANVIQRYFTEFIPAAVQLAEQTRLSGGDRFIWTTGSWLIYEYLEQASPADMKKLETAILAGDIVWHALPFTTHTELLDASLFEFGLSLSQELDRRFGKHTIAAKMTDVPGHTRAIVPYMSKAGVKLLHIGVNPASAVPDVPPVFRWQSPGGEEIIVIYQGQYGSTLTIPGFDQALAFAHSSDNLGPQTEDQMRESYAHLRTEFPDATVAASTLNDFAEALWTIKESLPIVTSEIGDTWIHGAGSDPVKIAQFRQLMRSRRDWLERSVYSGKERRFKDFSRKLLMVAEHTWGLDIKTHLADMTHYDAEDFQSVRNQDNFKKVETSWAEKRSYITEAVEALRNPIVGHETEEQLLSLLPAPPDLNGWKKLKSSHPHFEAQDFSVDIDPQSGSLTNLHWNKFPWAKLADVLPTGLFTYQSFSKSDYDRCWEQYIRKSPEVIRWAKADFEKTGLENSRAVSRVWLPDLCDGYEKENNLLLFLTFPEEATLNYGAPRLVTVEWQFDPEEPRAFLTLQWFDKPACRLPEALWLSFAPISPAPVHCWVEKLGELIDVQDVVSRGARSLHAVGRGLLMENLQYQFEIETLDAPLVTIGKQKGLDFDDRLPNLNDGVHFNLYNNLWGTNFPMWFEENMKFRFRLNFIKK